MVVIFALCLAWYIFCVMPERAGSCALRPCCVRAADKSDSAVGFEAYRPEWGGAAAGTPPSEKLALTPFYPIALGPRQIRQPRPRGGPCACAVGNLPGNPGEMGPRYGKNGGTKPKPAPNPTALSDLHKRGQMEREKGAFAAV